MSDVGDIRPTQQVPLIQRNKQDLTKKKHSRKENHKVDQDHKEEDPDHKVNEYI